MKTQQLDVTAIARLKHAELWKVCKRMGGQAAVAKKLGVHQAEFGRWVNLQKCPPSKPNKWWSVERIQKLESDLLEMTGLLMDDLFPAALRNNQKLLDSPKVFERTRRMRVDALLDYATQTRARLDYSGEAEKKVDNLELNEALSQVLSALDPRSRGIIEMRFGLNGKEPATLAECGSVYKVCKERIREIEARVMQDLRRPPIASMLVGHLDDLSPSPCDIEVVDYSRCPFCKHINEHGWFACEKCGHVRVSEEIKDGNQKAHASREARRRDV